jgi:MFS transporter, ENTS family, enterobactin (siderophore) exporter
VSSLYLAQVTSAPALGNVEAGAVARFAGLDFSVVSGGLACVLGAIVLGALIPALRHATLPQQADAENRSAGQVPAEA